MDTLAKLSPTITNMIRADHTHVLATFHQYAKDTRASTKQALVDRVCLALEVHTQLEEEIFYPALRTVVDDASIVNKSVPEHDEMRAVIAQLRKMDPTDPEYDLAFMSLMRTVMHHVADEETTLLPQAEALLRDSLHELGTQMTKRRVQLIAPRTGELAYNAVRNMPGRTALVAAGLLLAGTYLARRANNRRPSA